MSKLWQFNALMRKNLILMKRSCCATICEIAFPIILMIILVLVRMAFKIYEYPFILTDKEYFQLNSTALIRPNEIPSAIASGGWNGLKIRESLSICRTRPFIAVIGDGIPVSILQNILLLKTAYVSGGKKPIVFQFVNYTSVEELENYISSDNYGTDNTTNPVICFGLFFKQIDQTNFNYSLHYFDASGKAAIQNVPSTLKKPLDPFQNCPDMDSYEKYLNSGYLEIMKIINDAILQTVTQVPGASINFGLMAQKYQKFQTDQFGGMIGFIVPFFLIIAYICPLCITVFRMVQEKETRAKEGMKIMGMGEGVYFLSYFIQYLITNSIYALVNSLILLGALRNVGYIFILGFFWLFGMNVFALAYFFQAIMDKTRIAMIVSILVYFIFYFVSIAVLSEDVGNFAKMLLSLLPPTSLQLGLTVLGKFEANAIKFDSSKVTYKYNNFSVSDMYLMFFVDFILFLFLGFYLQNIISHQFGLKRPFYFLCTRRYWCKTQNYKIPSDNNIELSVKSNSNAQLADHDPTAFQNEDLYADKIKSGDYFNIVNLKKIFDGGIRAVDGVSLNLYRNEIFALLGHNGAGKSTMISILSGLYEASGGAAYLNKTNILLDSNMENFRKKLGICPQHDVLFGNLTVEEHLRMFCVFKGVDTSKIQSEINQILKEFHLTEKKEEIARNLSGGQRRKLSIAIALIGGSEIIFLDEPSSGMDITSRRNLWEILKKLTENKIIVLTTHYMEEASVLGRRIGIISNGKLKCLGTPLYLIEKYGKYISLFVSKHPEASNDQITAFVTSHVKDVQYEILSEEILFRIPKPQKRRDKKISNGKHPLAMSESDIEVEKTEFSLQNFFEDLDKNLENLKIKSYGASMPTLEDVFLNVSSTHKGLLSIGFSPGDANENEKAFMSVKMKDESCCAKFFGDLQSSLMKRFLQIVRDKKTFFLEILCPILLVLIGLGVSCVTFLKNSPSLSVNIQQIPGNQTIVVNSFMFDGNPLPSSFIPSIENVTYSQITIDKSSSSFTSIATLMNMTYQANYTNTWGAYYFLKADTTKHDYQFVLFSNTQARHAPILYSQHMLTQIISYAAGKPITINYSHRPLPLTQKVKSQAETRNNATLIFFVSIAFALIPANFITLIIKEREQNTKHLQIISGISLSSYWISNFIFELIKYYFIGGINLLLILAFDFFPPYLWLLYLTYGFSMVSFTYMFSFIFTSEATGQNVVILLNFLVGALGGSVIMMLRVMDDLIKIGKGLSFLLRIVPSYAFSYGYNSLLSAQLLFVTDYPTTFYNMTVENDILRPEYVGADVIYMGFESVGYIIILILCEALSNKCSCVGRQRKTDTSMVKDNQVKLEIDKANLSDQHINASDADEEKRDGYAIKVRNLEKNYSTGALGCCSPGITAVNQLSFCLEYGECFALLGVNGSGKTTTFKCMTRELNPTSGKIYINGLDISRNFDNVRNLIGYCPQFDSLFEYMTVKENLNFYARIKGIHTSERASVINSMLNEMNLVEYVDKVAGNLSGGNKRKLSVAIAMIGNPPIVLLDEPSSGMDPEARRFMWAVIHKISKKRKMSSVILTTHSMEEAETLCRRIGIMVKGQFRCLGTSQVIKDNYGYGYELDLRITPLPENVVISIMKDCDFHQDLSVNEENLAACLGKLSKANYLKEISEGNNKLGSTLYKEMKSTGAIPIVKLITWACYIEQSINIISKVLEYFRDITLTECVDNNFIYKIRKDPQTMEKSIGFLFGYIEEIKEEFHIAEYSISQTSLEQIFNQFASETDEEVLMHNKIEIPITRELVDSLLFKF